LTDRKVATIRRQAETMALDPGRDVRERRPVVGVETGFANRRGRSDAAPWWTRPDTNWVLKSVFFPRSTDNVQVMCRLPGVTDGTYFLPSKMSPLIASTSPAQCRPVTVSLKTKMPIGKSSTVTITLE